MPGYLPDSDANVLQAVISKAFNNSNVCIAVAIKISLNRLNI